MTRRRIPQRTDVRCYGAFEPREGIAIMTHEQVDVSISGNATHMIRFQHPVAGAYKKYCSDNGKRFLPAPPAAASAAH